MNKYYVYYHRNLINNKYYVGITCKEKPEYRWGKDGNNYSDQIFGSAIRKYGWDNFEHVIVCKDLSKEEACKMESELIKKYNSRVPNGYNVELGGQTNYKQGLIICVETNEVFENAEDVILKQSKILKDKYISDDIIKCCEYIYPYIKIPWKNENYHYQYYTKHFTKDISVIEQRYIYQLSRKKNINLTKIKSEGKYIRNGYKVCNNCGNIYKKPKNQSKNICLKCKERGLFFDSESIKNSHKIKGN